MTLNSRPEPQWEMTLFGYNYIESYQKISKNITIRFEYI